MFTALRLTAALFLIFGTSPLWVEPLFSRVAAEREVPAAEPEQIDPDLLIAVVETEKFRLFYPVAFTDTMSLRSVLTRLVAAYDRVEKEFGAFERSVDVYVPGRILVEGAEEHGLRIAGLTYDADGQLTILVAFWAAGDVDTFAHELLHARLRDAEIHPPHWFEEGLAHFIESEDGFNEELYEILLEKGPLSLEKAFEIEGITEDEMQLRATAWLLTYYLHEFEGMTLGEIATIEELPDPFVALEYVGCGRESAVEVSEELNTQN